MRSLLTISALCTFVLAPVVNAQAQAEVRWEPTLDSAKRVAAQTNRLVLVHFWAPWCRPCLRLEQEVFARPGFGQSLEQQFVLVKLNADHFPATARQFGVTTLPTDVVLSPTGEPVAKLQCPAEYDRYLGQLQKIAADAGGRVGGPYADLNFSRPGAGSPSDGVVNPAALAPSSNSAPFMSAAAAPSAAAPNPAAPTRVNAGWGTTPSYSPAAPAAAVGLSGRPAMPAGGVQGGAAPASPPAGGFVSLPPSTPQLALDGYCPVELNENRRWIKGDPRWGAIHEGRTYLFAGATQQQKFLARPELYSPVLAGDDPVAAVDHNQALSGKREFGVFYRGRVYLFADAGTRDRFAHAPERYTAETIAARLQGTAGQLNR